MTTTDTTVCTVADELKTTAARLRCGHSFPIQPPHGSLAHPGPCKHCGMPYPADDEWIPDALREPLAAWLMDTATWWDSTTAYGPDGDDTLHHVTPECCMPVEECGCFHRALDLARAINGTRT